MPLPSDFVFFGVLEPSVQPFLKDRCYEMAARLFNTVATSDDRAAGDVVVYHKHDVC